MKLNNKGFTFVEILAVIAIIGILSGISIIGVSKYRESAKNKDYEALAKSSYNAMEEYMMANPYKKEVTLKTLDEGEFLSNRIDPATKNTNCEGSVIVKTTKTAGVMDDNTYTVYLCCTNYKKMYTYPDGEEKDIDDPTKCDITETGSDDYVIPEPLPGEATYKITYNLNGGTVTGNPDKYSKSMLPFTIKNPTRSGYTFDGWTGSNGTTAQKTVTLAEGTTGDKTYTANWKVNTNPSYTITLNNNGATKAGTASVKVQVGDTNLSKIIKPVKEVTISYVNNVGATVSGGDTKKAYTLDGWYTAASGGNKVASNSDTPILQSNVSGFTDKNNKWTKKSDTTLYAQWANVTATLPKVTKTGYTCKWTTLNSGKTQERESGGQWTFSSANSRTFTAVCTPKTVVVTFNCNGGKGGGNSTYTYDKTGQKFNKNCSRTGYTQSGWNLKEDGTTVRYKVTNGVSDSWINRNSPSITIYATWTMNKPSAPTLTNPNGTNWTNKNVNLSVSTTTPTAIIGKWYYSFKKDSEFKVLKDKNSESTTGKQKFTSIAYTGERNAYTYIRVCNKNASGPTDKTNCSNVSKVIIKIDKTPPTLKNDTWTVCNSNHYLAKEFGYEVKDSLSGVDISKTTLYLRQYYTDTCAATSSASWRGLDSYVKSDGWIHSGVLCGGFNRYFEYKIEAYDKAGNVSKKSNSDRTNQAATC